MRDLYQKIIEKYRSSTTEVENSFKELWNIHNFYRIRRHEYIGITMLICSFIPFFVFVLGSSLYFASKNLHSMMLRWVMIGVVAFCSFVIAPIVLWMRRVEFKEYNPKIKNKTRTEIITDDFQNYLERLTASIKVEINSKVINHFEAEIKNLDDKESLLASLKGEYNISLKKPVNSKEDSEKAAEVEQLSTLEQEYQKELKQEIKRLAISNFFSCSFKRDWMTMCMNGMMGAMMLMMVWNLPVFATISQPQISNSNNWLFQLCISVFLPLVVGFGSPFFWNFYNRKWMSKAFEGINSELNIPADTKKYCFDVKAEAEENIEELENKIALTKSKIEIFSK